jgi:hypothetical protein
MQRLAVIVDNATAASPGGERILEVDYAGAKAADVVIGPQAIAGQVLAGSRRGVDQAADQPARRAATAVADAHALVLGAASPALQIAQLHRAGMGIGETVHGQRLQALGLKAGLSVSSTSSAGRSRASR